MTQPFTHDVARRYDACFAPAVFVPFAAVTARLVAESQPRDVLELACGTGRATVAIAAALPGARITATDISPDMLDYARRNRCAPNVTWELCDATDLPYPDASYDVVACQFGAMFFPDRPLAYAGFRRVLRPGGRLVLVVWDDAESHAFARILMERLRAMMDDPPQFLERIPHGYHDPAQIEADVVAGGFSDVSVTRSPYSTGGFGEPHGQVSGHLAISR
ncbi:class I SAM-dependent methyltransferase [Luteipulveratus halotolerans]|uniref:class I SAM-dependent methyltransferase n=1 Tax=Luteipulveratus halotolerans TaxID=1631356 RepID=UPI00067F9DFB|nr:class I SAM-dependent methyltransferase [Luteipulveratus halotolerans]